VSKTQENVIFKNVDTQFSGTLKFFRCFSVIFQASTFFQRIQKEGVKVAFDFLYLSDYSHHLLKVSICPLAWKLNMPSRHIWSNYIHQLSKKKNIFGPNWLSVIRWWSDHFL